MIMALILMIQNKEMVADLAMVVVGSLSNMVKADFISKVDFHLVEDSPVEPNSKCIFNTSFISHPNCTKTQNIYSLFNIIKYQLLDSQHDSADLFVALYLIDNPILKKIWLIIPWNPDYYASYPKAFLRKKKLLLRGLKSKQRRARVPHYVDLHWATGPQLK
jgi:uncharacterized membrane protein